MTKPNTKELIEKLEKEGYANIRVCPLPPNTDTPEHTHDQHTVHIILSGELTIIDNEGTATYHPGDRIEFPAGTTHKAKGSVGEMVIGVEVKS